MKVHVTIRTDLCTLVDTIVDAERSMDAGRMVMERPDVAAHLNDLKFAAYNMNVRPLTDAMYADLKELARGAAEAEWRAAA